MAKRSREKDREDKARRKLTKAQLDLHAAQEKRTQAVARAQAEVEAARLRGAAWVEKATERVERRAGHLARAEATLIAASAGRKPVRRPAAPSLGPAPEQQDLAQAPIPPASSADPFPETPQSAAETLERIENESEQTADATAIVLPDGSPIEVAPESESNDGSSGSQLHPW